MVKIQKCAHSEIFLKITDFCQYLFSAANKFKIDLELNLSKSEFVDFNILADLLKKKKKKKT
jgi:hypothetical protein